jgi:hypothetical protein
MYQVGILGLLQLNRCYISGVSDFPGDFNIHTKHKDRRSLATFYCDA